MLIDFIFGDTELLPAPHAAPPPSTSQHWQRLEHQLPQEHLWVLSGRYNAKFVFS